MSFALRLKFGARKYLALSLRRAHGTRKGRSGKVFVLISLVYLWGSVVIWMSRPPNWLLGPRVRQRSRESAPKIPVECVETVEKNRRCPKRAGIKYKVKKKWEWNRVDVFPWGDSCLLDNCLKIVNPFSMDIYHFPADVHSQPAAIYQGRQTRRKGAWPQGR